MAKAQGKKASAGRKSPAKKVAARVKSAVGAARKKVAPKKAAAAPKPLKKKVAPVAKAKAVAKKVKAVAKKVAAKVPVKAAPKSAAKPAPARPAAKVVAKPAASVAKPAPKAVGRPPKVALKPAAVPPVPPKGPVALKVPPVAAPPKAEEKKRTRRPRLRVTSSGAPAAAWLSTEKPRPASFIPAPPRAEAPSAIAAPPASSDRLIRPEEVIELMVRTVPVRVDVEQGAGRFYVIANPLEVTLRPGEGIEWDFRYVGGADVNVDEIIVEFERPSPFQPTTFKTRKPGGARPHRQLSGPVNAAAAGKRVPYTIRAMSAFKTELASAKMYLNVNA